MKTISTFFLCMLMLGSGIITGCDKDDICDPVDPVDPVVQPMTKTEMLSMHTWIYEEFYTNWQQPGQYLAYKRGRGSNTINYTPNRVKFFRNGTFEETMNDGLFRSGIWQFQNNQTVLATGSTAYSNTVNIIKLTVDSLVWHDPINNSYAVQLAKK